MARSTTARAAESLHPLGQLLWYADDDRTEVAVCTLYERDDGPSIECDNGPLPDRLRAWLDAYQRVPRLPITELAGSLLAALLLWT